MKITFSNDRTDTTGKHNDRNFDISKAGHIDSERSHLNKYYTYKGDYYDGETLSKDDSIKTLRDIELDFYKENFAEYINSQNERNTKAGHKERNRTLEQYFRSYTTRPEGMIFEIGNYFEHVSPEELWACAMEYAQTFNRAYGEHCKILDMALHMDEGSPHVHIRRVWIGEDDYGCKCVGQNKALENMGFERPDKDKEISKFNNAKISFTKNNREMITNICLNRNIDIDIKKTSSQKKEKSMPLEMYREKHPLFEKLKKMEESIIKNENVLAEQEKCFEQMRLFFLQLLEKDEIYKKKLREAEDMERQEKFKTITEVYEKAIKPAFENTPDNVSLQVVFGNIQKDIVIRQHERFLNEKGLNKEFVKYKDKELIDENRNEKNKHIR